MAQLILRRRKVAAPTEPITRVALVSRTARPRVANNASTREQAAKAARERIDQHMLRLAEVHRLMDELSDEQDTLHARIEDELRGANLSEHSDGVYRATVEEVFSRQTTTIDPKKFRAKVADRTFWETVEVPVGKAKGVMSLKEYNEIADVVSGKSMGYVFKIKPVERKK